ncbi:putative DASH complex subunit Duo1 [Lyophyllum shimeji]|uniref:DASH complex subunit DUO1 n=1 Tax=Lyophyllum shimeji TaxID=47721 RepID=A0A9P3PK75_LYOSH|nr:putative DASH complex subunit Duo1 [Lyophyllum shimeji]
MYDSLDSSNILVPASGSRLLSESPVLPSSSSRTGLGGDDLSISELSLADITPVSHKPFSLLAPAEQAFARQDQHEDEQEHQEAEADIDDAEEVEQKHRHAAKMREEKLQSDIFVLRKLNASFAVFNEALQDAGSANQRVAAQLEHTDALLNKYIAILAKSEQFARLIFDEQWQGAEADEEVLERERIEARDKARREAEERALAAQREEERRQREEQQRIEQEERERIERETREKAAARGGVRGVRGTRASMRGARGTTRIAPGTNASSRGRATGTTAAAQTITSKLPMPATGIRSTSSAQPARGSRRS